MLSSFWHTWALEPALGSPRLCSKHPYRLTYPTDPKRHCSWNSKDYQNTVPEATYVCPVQLCLPRWTRQSHLHCLVVQERWEMPTGWQTKSLWETCYALLGDEAATKPGLLHECALNAVLDVLKVIRTGQKLGWAFTESRQGAAHSHFHSLLNVSDAEIQCDHNFCLLVDSLVVVIFN